MFKQPTFKLFLHSVALLFEACGVVLIFLDSVRMDVLIKAAAFAGNTGQTPPEYSAWYYHSSTFGLGLLLGGMVLAAIILFTEHWSHVSSIKNRSIEVAPVTSVDETV